MASQNRKTSNIACIERYIKYSKAFTWGRLGKEVKRLGRKLLIKIIILSAGS